MHSNPLFHLAASPWVVGLLTHLWQSTAVALAILGLLLVSRGLSARTRRTLGWIALLKFALPAAWLGQFAARFAAPPQPWRMSDGPTMVASASTTVSLSTPVVASWVAPSWLWPLLALVWLSGATFLLVRWIVRAARVRRALLATAQPVSADVERAVASAAARAGLRAVPRCLEGERDHGPGAVGVVSPVLLLPSGLGERLSSAEREAILVHECVHLQRRDNLWAAVRAGFVAALWFNPIAWLLSRAIAIETEKSCDERVLEITGDAEAYARSIVTSVRHTLGLVQPGIAGATTPPVLARIQNILSYPERPDRRLGRWVAVVVAVALVLLSSRAGSIAATAVPENAPVKLPQATAESNRADPNHADVKNERKLANYRIGTLTIRTAGAATGSYQAVRAVMQMRAGGEFDERILDRDVRAIYALGLFKTVEVKHEAVEGEIVNLVVELTPKPAVGVLIGETADKNLLAAVAPNSASLGPGDRQLLEKLAAQISPTAMLEKRDNRILKIGNQSYEAGARFKVQFDNQDYELELAALERTAYTLRYRGEEIVRPIASSVRSFKLEEGRVVLGDGSHTSVVNVHRMGAGTLTLGSEPGAESGVTFKLPARPHLPLPIATPAGDEELRVAQAQLAAESAELKRMREEREQAVARQRQKQEEEARRVALAREQRAAAPGGPPTESELNAVQQKRADADARLAELRAEREAMEARYRAATPIEFDGPVFEPKELDRTPVVQFQARPQYPFEMRRAGITGEVVVDFIVDTDGRVQLARAIRSSRVEFEASAVQAVSKWKYLPGQKNGKSVPTHLQTPIIFTIQN